ncbi:MAG TPA: pyridoxal-phosphate dependent enzyme [Chloroflexota bacterium]
MATEQALECARCGGRFKVRGLFGCPTCRERGRLEPLEMAYDLAAARDGLAAALRPGGRAPGLDHGGVWRWRALLPRVGVELTLGEGRTPLLASQVAGPALGLGRLLLKYEGAGPTGSYKDRYQAVAIAAAKGLGFSRVFCASTGNHGTAAAAYARLAGLAALVLLHEEAPLAFDEAIQCYGGTVGRVPPGERDGLMRELVEAGWFPATCLAPLPIPNPFGAEGYKTIAYELVEQLERPPDAVVLPVGAGDGYYGVAKGFAELTAVGLTGAGPRLFAVQPVGADPLARAAASDAAEVRPLEAAARSPALSIREAATGAHALRAARASGGTAVAVEDAETLRAARLLADEGLIVDVASAAAVAGAARLARDGLVEAGQTVVAVLTASGARWPRPFGYELGGRLVRGSADDVRRVLGLG